MSIYTEHLFPYNLVELLALDEANIRGKLMAAIKGRDAAWTPKEIDYTPGKDNLRSLIMNNTSARNRRSIIRMEKNNLKNARKIMAAKGEPTNKVTLTQMKGAVNGGDGSGFGGLYLPHARVILRNANFKDNDSFLNHEREHARQHRFIANKRSKQSFNRMVSQYKKKAFKQTLFGPEPTKHYFNNEMEVQANQSAVLGKSPLQNAVGSRRLIDATRTKRVKHLPGRKGKNWTIAQNIQAGVQVPQKYTGKMYGGRPESEESGTRVISQEELPEAIRNKFKN